MIKNSKDLKSAAILSTLEDKYVKTILFEICYSHLELQPNFLRKLKNSFRNWATGFSLKVSECSEYSNDSHHNCNTAFIIIANLVTLLLGTHFWQAIMLQGKIDGIRFKRTNISLSQICHVFLNKFCKLDYILKNWQSLMIYIAMVCDINTCAFYSVTNIVLFKRVTICGHVYVVVTLGGQ